VFNELLKLWHQVNAPIIGSAGTKYRYISADFFYHKVAVYTTVISPNIARFQFTISLEHSLKYSVQINLYVICKEVVAFVRHTERTSNVVYSGIYAYFTVLGVRDYL